MLNGEPPKAAETRAYLDRVRAYLNRTEPYAASRQTPETFAARTGRRVALDAENRPTFEDGTAYPREAIGDFYAQRVATLGKDDAAPMPDVLFRIGEVDDFTAAGLRDFLPGFDDNLREARISAQAIKHIHDSRPGIAREVLQRLDDGTLYADEVLPNPVRQDRALLVLRDITEGKKTPSHAVTVLEVGANGNGIDIVTSMTSPSRSKTLRDARKMKEDFASTREASGAEGQQPGQAPRFPSSSLADKQAGQPHAAADFPTLAPEDASVSQAQASGATAGKGAETAAMRAASEAVDIAPDMRIRMEDGTDVSAREALQRANDDIARAQADSRGILAAVTCFLRTGG